MVRAKFVVMSKTETVGPAFEVELWPVACGSPENEKFYRYTPGGKIHLATINPDAAAELRVGAEYFVDFSEAPEQK